MKTAKALVTICALLLTLALAAPFAHADGVMIPRPIPNVLPYPTPFTVKYHRVDVSVENQAATTVIDQVFVNNNDHEIEGTYIFPIPETASITEFSMWMNGAKITGELLDAEEARRIYQDIVRQMKDPGLLEYAGRDMYRARVYPIPARGEVKIELAYQEVLTYDAGLVTYRYPLDTERFSAEPIEDVSITVEIGSNVPIKSVYSPSHEVDVSVAGTTATCGFEAADVRPDRDFFLYYTVSEDDLGLNLITHRAGPDDGYFLLLLSPGLLEDPGVVLPKDIVFVFDRSGSMGGKKIEQARAALRYALENLNGRDRFNVITFATQDRSFADELVPATEENVLDALAFVEKIEAGGSTNIDDALELALDLPSSVNPQMVVFMTDGLPTAGETDVATILEHVEERNDGVRIFTFGVGYDVNTTLLDRLSLDSRGTVDYVKPGENLEHKVSSFYSKVAKPILADITIDFDDIETYDVYPIDLPDVFNGAQVTIFGRYEGAGATELRLRGTVGTHGEEFVYRASFPRRERDHDFIPPLWASRKIAYLMTEIRLRGEEKELREEVVRLATEYGIVTPYTSYLVREDLLASGEGGVTITVGGQRVTGVNSMRDAVASTGVSVKFGGPRLDADLPMPPPAMTFEAESGKDAVQWSAGLASDRERKVAPTAESGMIQRVGTKLFFYDTGVDGWIDSAFEEGDDATEIEYLSDDYFELLDRSPEIGRFLSLGERVTFVFEGRAYRVVRAGGLGSPRVASSPPDCWAPERPVAPSWESPSPGLHDVEPARRLNHPSIRDTTA